ncbi:MAG: DUF4962 domain-containing protein [Vicinamibacteraceae bacterium]
MLATATALASGIALPGLSGGARADGRNDSQAESSSGHPKTMPPPTDAHPRLVFVPGEEEEQRTFYRANPFFEPLKARATAQPIDSPAALRDVAFIAQVEQDATMAALAVEAFGALTAPVLDGTYSEDDDQAQSMTLTNLGFAYDWLHQYLDETAKRDGAEALVQLIVYARENFAFNFRGTAEEFPYAAFNNHAIQAWAAQAVAGLAAAEEHPDALGWAEQAYDNFVGVIFPIFDLVAGDGGTGIWGEGTHYNQVALKPVFYFMDSLRSSAGVSFYDFPWVRSCVYFWPYVNRPDDTFLTLGDWFARSDLDTVRNLYSRTFWVIAKAAAETGDPYLQAYANSSIAWIQSDRMEAWNIAWYNPTLSERPVSNLPRDRFFRSNARDSGESLAVLRSGWDDGATIVSVCGGDWTGHHDHLDAAAFTIFHKGDLAADHGYEGETLNDWRFFRRTAAHSSILVDAPEAAEELINHEWGWDGGGQRVIIITDRPRNVEQYNRLRHPDYPERSLFDTGAIVDRRSAEDYAYVVVDATLAYRRSQVERFFRHVLFLKPHVLVVYDVLATPPDRSPMWLMQTVTQPQVGSAAFGVVSGGGELRAVTLLPEQATVQAPATLAGHRVEVTGDGSPDRDTHRFLHVLTIGDAGNVTSAETRWEREGNELNVWIRHDGRSRTVHLPWNGKPM